MHNVLTVFVVTAYAVVLTFVAVRARAARDFAEFSLASRHLPLALVFGSLCATYVGPAFSIGFVGKGFQAGILFLCVALAYAVQNVMVGAFVAPKLRELKGCHTLGDIIGMKYDINSHVLAGLISVGICAGLAAVMASAGGVVLKDVFGLGKGWAVIIVVGVTALYTTFGGLRASVVTDAFQFSSFAILLPVTLVLVLLFHVEGGMNKFVGQLSTSTSEGFGSIGFLEMAGLLAAFLLGETLIPPYANRALASKSSRISRNGFLMAGIFSVFWFVVMISLGVAARGIVPPTTSEDDVLLTLFKSTMPAEGYALLLVILISIIMSSLDSLLNAGAVAFIEDIVRPFVRVQDRIALALGRWATVGIAGVAAAAAVEVPSIIKGLLVCYTIWAPAILPALTAGLWIKRPCPLAGFLSMIVGTFVSVLFQFILPTEIEAIIPAFAAAILAYVAGHLIGKFRIRSAK